jgi:hypothetical protein
LRDRVLFDIFRLLKPGGAFMFQSHNKSFIGRARFKWKKYSPGYFKETNKIGHDRITFYSSPKAQSVSLRKKGFKEIQMFGIFKSVFMNCFFDYAPIWVCRKEQRELK